VTSSHNRKDNGHVGTRKAGVNGLGPAASGAAPAESTEVGAGQPAQGGAMAEDQSKRAVRRDGARRTEQLVILSVAIVLGGVGLAFHPFWIAALVLMAVLWGYLASDIRSRGGGVVSDVVGTVVSEAKEVAKAASGPVSAPDDEDTSGPLGSPSTDGGMVDEDGHGRQVVGADQQAPPAGISDDQEPTRKELYALAQEADIPGRSNMNKEELKEALDG
jgi:hypothetical protein